MEALSAIDWRIIVVVGPIAIAISWALFNIGAAALSQARNFLSDR